MNMKHVQAIVLLTAVAVLCATTGCAGVGRRVRVGELRTKSESIELGDADAVRVEINMAAGELDVSGGADDLLEASFRYNVAELEPEVAYGDGTLTVRTPGAKGQDISWWDLDDFRYEWDLRLSDDVPMEMNVDMGAGSANLELGSLSLTRLGVKTGAGDVTVDLSDSSSLTRFEVELGAGQVDLDLTGNWQKDLDVNLSGGVGELVLQLPSSVGVRVDIETGIGDVDTQGLIRNGDGYVNDAYGESDVTLRIDIEAGIGKITLRANE